ncbi:spore Coat protein U domain family [Candidatus Rickettsiella viridis]|uniref:Spore Coat protein U domain family n=1 Tax=Candidatus Rickettsiella viridis TaxID=676208 RepID=A0A2Z5UV90_9COXI|nr:spore coat U domain-containing protein [Candidatus Rickettsiella viridis]BBB14873.1 spore Coat protein U domain family [Candidatus Rickettsiella viridis]
MLYLVRIWAGLFLIFIWQNALSGTVAGALAVTAKVGGDDKCVINGVTNLIFPSYNSFNPKPDDASGSMTVTCTANLAYEVGMGRGDGAEVKKGQHRTCIKNDRGEELLNGGDSLEYNLFSDPNHKSDWGSESGENTMHRIGTGLAQIINIYGEIPIHQPVEAGSYTDWVTIFVAF